METVEVVYYVCRNNECPKHRNIFLEGDPQHDGCERERMLLEGQRAPMPRWVWFAIPAAIALGVGGFFLARMMRVTQGQKPPMLRGQEELKTWSGAHAHRDDREGNAVPPPIS